MTYEGMRLKILKYYRKMIAKSRGRILRNKDFTIISNNCWGGMIYDSYCLQKQSPTVGLFFIADDYIKFISDIKRYVNTELKFIYPESSKWRCKVCEDKRYGSYPVGILDDIEIFFLHYHNEQEAYEKWNRRC